jgi:hypothetical protein
MKYSSTDYELFTRTLHQQIIEQEGFEGVEVLHDVFFTGRSGARHQIDVCWKVRVANVEQLFCVECKLFKSKVKKSDIAAFITKIEDIGSARGLFVTTIGYQIGALRLAKHNGVVLMSATYEIENRPATLEMYIPIFHDVTTTFGEMPDDVVDELDRMSQAGVSANETEIYDSEGRFSGYLSDLTEGVEYHQDGDNKLDVQNTYVKVLGLLVEVRTLSYFYERKYLGWPLTGSYEVANAYVKYIFDDKEIKAVLNSHRDNW